jgi:hypothetical protein
MPEVFSRKPYDGSSGSWEVVYVTSPQGTLISLAAVVPDRRLRMIDRHPFENAVADDIGAPVKAVPLLIGETLSA